MKLGEHQSEIRNSRHDVLQVIVKGVSQHFHSLVALDHNGVLVARNAMPELDGAAFAVRAFRVADQHESIVRILHGTFLERGPATEFRQSSVRRKEQHMLIDQKASLAKTDEAVHHSGTGCSRGKAFLTMLTDRYQSAICEGEFAMEAIDDRALDVLRPTSQRLD